MAQDYDKIFKENIEDIILPLTKRLGIKPEKLEKLSIDDLQRTIERRPDFVRKVSAQNPDSTYILHIEFQTEDEQDMVYRMLEYYALLLRKYKLGIKQYVFFLQKKQPSMPTKIQIENLSFSFELISMHSFSYRSFLNSDILEEAILAILGDFGKDPAEKVIKSILQHIKEAPDETIHKQKCVTQLEILANLRKLQPEVLKQISAMPIVYNLKEDLRYLQGVEEARKEFLEKLALKDAELQKAKETELKAKETEQKAKETEQKAKETEIKVIALKMWSKGASVDEIIKKLSVSVAWLKDLLED